MIKVRDDNRKCKKQGSVKKRLKEESISLWAKYCVIVYEFIPLTCNSKNVH